MPKSAKAYISLVSVVGLVAVAIPFLDPPWTLDPLRYGTYFVLSLLAASLKLRLPGLTGTMSLSFVFVLLGISELTLAETMLMACAGAIVQCLWRPARRPAALQVMFSVAAVAISLTLAYHCGQLVQSRIQAGPIAIVLAVVTCVYFLSNSMLVCGVLSVVKGQSFQSAWQQCYFYAFPYYLLGGVVAGLMIASDRVLGWQASLSLLPVMGLSFLFYRMWLGRMELSAQLSAIRVNDRD